MNEGTRYFIYFCIVTQLVVKELEFRNMDIPSEQKIGWKREDIGFLVKKSLAGLVINFRLVNEKLDYSGLKGHLPAPNCGHPL